MPSYRIEIPRQGADLEYEVRFTTDIPEDVICQFDESPDLVDLFFTRNVLNV